MLEIVEQYYLSLII